MKRYIIIPFILSIIGHGLFFSVFRTGIKPERAKTNLQLFLITKEQFDYISGITKAREDITISLFPRSLSIKNNIWKDILEMIKDDEIMNLDIIAQDEAELFEDFKSYNFREIPILLDHYSDITCGSLEGPEPIFTDLLIPNISSQISGYTTRLRNNLYMRYYIQGPILSRGLIFSDIEDLNINIDKPIVYAKLRVWITRDGSISQVIVEESSSFPIVDFELVDVIKKWRFSPVYNPSTPNYEWGVIVVRLQR